MLPLYVAIVWHMHQPYYRDLRDGGIPLPWVRLHAAKDYLHMAEILARHPQVHLTINMVPSLVEQMLDWAEGRAVDDLARVAEQETWSDADRRFMLGLCYSINWDKIIRRYPRYAELLDRRPAALADPAAFSDADYRDLVTWFNLAWIDHNWLARDAELNALIQRGQGFTLADTRLVHAKQREIAARVLPLYCELAAAGQLEICASPYYHPILPLLANTDHAARATPGLPLPQPPFAAPEDAASQLALAVQSHTERFGAAPAGLWPSEGAVSPEVLGYVRAAGFRWLATDEAILAASLGRALTRDGSNLLTEPAALYRPYRVLAGSEPGPTVIFRDHELSDRIGFLYQHLPGVQAAEDLIYRLLEIRKRLNDPASPYLVSIILDGENCWEHYEAGGDVFLDALYGEFERRSELCAVTVSEYLDGRRPAATLAKLATGSWIGGDLTTWIGDPEHNRAWDALRRTREDLGQRSRLFATEGSEDSEASPPLSPLSPLWQDQEAAWRALFAAEGSDWFWWYSHRNSSDQDALFDRLFRHALAAVYERSGQAAPAWLETPIQRGAPAAHGRAASGYVTPVLAAAPFAGGAWATAAMLLPAEASTGTMQRASGVIERLFVGWDAARLHLRLELREALASYDALLYLGGGAGAANQRVDAEFPDPDQRPADLLATALLRLDAGQAGAFLYRADGHGGWAAAGPVPTAVGDRVIEMSAALSALDLSPADELRLYLALMQRGRVIAALPARKMARMALNSF